jgi:hypothetical protein
VNVSIVDRLLHILPEKFKCTYITVYINALFELKRKLTWGVQTGRVLLLFGLEENSSFDAFGLQSWRKFTRCLTPQQKKSRGS